MQRPNNIDYQLILDILVTNKEARFDNRKLLISFYKAKNMTLDEAFRSDGVLNYQSVERLARKVKENNPKLKVNKEDQEDYYKQIALENLAIVKI